MSRAEIKRINALAERRVKVICKRRALSVLPRAWKRASLWLCFCSSKTSNGRLKNTCSASNCLTPCFSTLFRSLPASHSKPVICAQSIMSVYYHHIHVVQHLKELTRPIAVARAKSARAGPRCRSVCVGGVEAVEKPRFIHPNRLKWDKPFERPRICQSSSPTTTIKTPWS